MTLNTVALMAILVSAHLLLLRLTQLKPKLKPSTPSTISEYHMAKLKQFPAAFINVIAEEGTKEDAIMHLQETWNCLMSLHTALIGLGFTKAQIKTMEREGKLGKVF
jgi:hypothetical protein